jgi:pyrimidine-specific ribonucleoside hydrolase
MHSNIELLGVTANGAGETRCKPAMKNIPALLDLTDIGEVVIACGDDYPLDGFFAFPEPWRVQADTLSGVAVKPSKRPISSQHSVEVLHTLLNKHDDVVLLTTGSLTNVAQLIEKYPADTKRISRLVIMGGAFEAKGNIIVPNFTDAHPNIKAEWNIYVDPVAANEVFAADIPTEVVGLDITNQVRVTAEFAKHFKQSVNTPAAEFWDKILDDNDWFIESGEYYFWDVLAALIVIDKQLCIGPQKPIYVQYDFITEPSKWTDNTISPFTAKGDKRQHLDPATAGITSIGGNAPTVKVCEQTNPPQAFKEFTATLNGLR